MPRFPYPGLVWFATLAILPAATASAEIPSASFSTAPAFIRVVGSTAGVPDTVAGNFVVTVRTVGNLPMPGVYVSVDVSGCPDIDLSVDQLNPNYRVLSYCSTHSLGAWTNTDGVVVLALVGSSRDAGTHVGLGCARIYANGVLLNDVTVAAFDLNGTGGVSAADLSICLGDLGAHVYRGRVDFNGDGRNSAADLSLLLGEIGTHRSNESATPCP